MSSKNPFLQNDFHSFRYLLPSESSSSPSSKLNRYRCHHSLHQQAQALAPLAPPTQYDSAGWRCEALLGIREQLATATLKPALTPGGPPA